MQTEVGLQVAPLQCMHQIQPLPPHATVAKKRGNPWLVMQPSTKTAAEAGGGGNWNPRMWDWDSHAFIARPSSDVLQLRGGQNHHHHHHQPPAAAMAAEAPWQGVSGLNLHLALQEEASMVMDVSPTTTLSSSPSAPVLVARVAQELVNRPSKRVQSRSPRTGSGGGGGGSAIRGGRYPMCQVDDCRADLTNAKDYHCRHKACEIHSKTTKAVVGK